MVNYKLAKIFKLYEVDNPNNFYISSTTEPCLQETTTIKKTISEK